MKYSIYIIIYTFLYVYCPPILPIYFLHILAAYSLFSLIVFHRIKYLKLILDTYMLSYVGLLSLATLYLLCILLSTQNSVLILFQYIYIMIEIPICIVYLCSYFIKHKYTVYDIVNILLIVGTIQGIIAMLSFFIPPFKEVITNYMAKNVISDSLSVDVLFAMSEHRLNGFSSTLTYAMPIVQSLLALISLYLALNKNYRYIFLLPILIFSALINARNSFIVFLYGLILLIIMSKKNTKTTMKISASAIVMIFITPLLMQVISNSSELAFAWISIGFDEIVSFFQGENTGYFDIMMTNFISLPDGLELVFGTGHRIFGLAIGGSDIGYINDLWLGGVWFASIIYFSFLSYYIKAYKNGDRLVRFIILMFIATFFTMNIKGIIVSNNEFINISVLLSAVFILNKKDKSFNTDKIEQKQ